MKPEQLWRWSERMQGARQMAVHLLERGEVDFGKGKGRWGRGNSKAHHEAMKEWLLDSLDNIQIFLNEPERIHYGNFENDKKGKLIKCKVIIK